LGIPFKATSDFDLKPARHSRLKTANGANGFLQHLTLGIRLNRPLMMLAKFSLSKLDEWPLFGKQLCVLFGSTWPICDIHVMDKPSNPMAALRQQFSI
jgi:hypothetical protein